MTDEQKQIVQASITRLEMLFSELDHKMWMIQARAGIFAPTYALPALQTVLSDLRQLLQDENK